MFRIPTIALATAVALAPGCQRDDKGSEESSAEVITEPNEDGQIPAPDTVAEPPDDAETTESGLAYKVLSEGDGGDSPAGDDRVKVHYTGWTTDGEMFDSSRTRGEPAQFPVGGVIPGWTEGLQLMSEGDTYRLWIPEDQAYGGKPGRPQGMLVFDVELLEIVRPPETPANLEPPEDAETTESGLAYKVLEEGDGGASPRSWDQVKVHYSGWTTEGEMFDSSFKQGRPVTFPLTNVIPGWTEGIQLMSEGDSYRLWIPEELAYQDNPKGPQGMLVFDVDLLEVNEMPEPPPVPDNVSEPPESAKTTDSGVRHQVIEESDSDERPEEDSLAVIHFTGWTTDGKMFDSSVTRDKTITVPLNQVFAGWSDGIQTMTVGQTSRFWIPEELASGEESRLPEGMLVFDIELVELKEPRPARATNPHGRPQPKAGAGGHQGAGGDEAEKAAEGVRQPEAAGEVEAAEK